MLMGDTPPCLMSGSAHNKLTMPEHTIVLERSTEVRTRDEVVGEIDHLLVDPLRQKLTQLVVRLRDQPHRRSSSRSNGLRM
jgi:hypothetical protein